MKNVIDISCFIVFGILIAAIDADFGPATSAPSTSAPSTLDGRINDWLEDLRHGRPGIRHWLVPAHAQQLTGVRFWEIVESTSSGRIVRIESSDMAGVPIVSLWQISLDDGKIVSIYRK